MPDSGSEVGSIAKLVRRLGTASRVPQVVAGYSTKTAFVPSCARIRTHIRTNGYTSRSCGDPGDLQVHVSGRRCRCGRVSALSSIMLHCKHVIASCARTRARYARVAQSPRATRSVHFVCHAGCDVVKKTRWNAAADCITRCAAVIYLFVARTIRKGCEFVRGAY